MVNAVSEAGEMALFFGVTVAVPEEWPGVPSSIEIGERWASGVTM